MKLCPFVITGDVPDCLNTVAADVCVHLNEHTAILWQSPDIGDNPDCCMAGTQHFCNGLAETQARFYCRNSYLLIVVVLKC